MSLIELRNLSYSYKTEGRSVPALRNVNLSVYHGEMIAIQGPSGSGKSTLLYIIGCLLKQDKGAVLFEGQDVKGFSNSKLALLRNKKIGFVFQQFHLLPKANVLENILLPTFYPCEFANPTGNEKEAAINLARKLGINDRLDHLPNQLSGGQQQRVAIGRALMKNPSLILADESPLQHPFYCHPLK